MVLFVYYLSMRSTAIAAQYNKPIPLGYFGAAVALIAFAWHRVTRSLLFLMLLIWIPVRAVLLMLRPLPLVLKKVLLVLSLVALTSSIWGTSSGCGQARLGWVCANSS
jgi:hypothetical protein